MADQKDLGNELKRETSTESLDRDWIEIVRDANGILISVHNHSQYTLERVKDREVFPEDLRWAYVSCCVFISLVCMLIISLLIQKRTT